MNFEENETTDEPDIVPINPIEEKDRKIAELEKMISEQAKVSSE